MELSAPRTIIFIISVIIALVAAVLHYGHVSVPYLAHSGFTLLFVGYPIWQQETCCAMFRPQKVARRDVGRPTLRIS
jgi:hypothetical protein